MKMEQKQLTAAAFPIRASPITSAGMSIYEAKKQGHKNISIYYLVIVGSLFRNSVFRNVYYVADIFEWRQFQYTEVH